MTDKHYCFNCLEENPTLEYKCSRDITNLKNVSLHIAMTTWNPKMFKTRHYTQSNQPPWFCDDDPDVKFRPIGENFFPLK